MLSFLPNESGFLMAFCIFMAIFLLPLFSKELRCNVKILIGYWFLIALHQVIAISNAYIFPHQTIGSHGDARTFYLSSKSLAMIEGWNLKIGGHFYTEFLGAIYRWFGVSHFLGEQLSVLAFALSCIVLIKIMRQLNIVRHKLATLLAFGSLPTVILVSSVTMREPYQIFFFMLAVHLGIKMQEEGGSNVYLVFFIISAIAMGCFHNILIVYSIFLVILFFVWNLRPSTQFLRIKKLHLLAIVIIPFFLFGVMIFSKIPLIGNSMISSLVNENMWELAVGFRTAASNMGGRTNYGIILDNSSLLMSIYSALRMYMNYLFAPFPWQIKSMLDIYAAVESSLRILLIYFSLKNWSNSYGLRKRTLGLMLILYISMTLMWAVGTTNYGTAIRHNMLTWWILVITGIPCLIDKLSSIWSLGSLHRSSKSFNMAKEV